MTDKPPNCICQHGAIHSVSGEDIPAGVSVMTTKEGYGSERKWVTTVAPFQIHEKEQNEKTVDVDRNAPRRVAYSANRSDAGGPDY